MDRSLTTEVMAIFLTFWPILAKIWWPWQRALEPSYQKSFLQIGRPRKLFVISNHILTVSRRNAFIAILIQKLVAKVTCLCPLCTGVSQMNSPIAQTLSQNQTLHGNVIQLKLWPFCDIFAYFGQNVVAMATSLRPLQSEMSSLDWSTTKTPCYK